MDKKRTSGRQGIPTTLVMDNVDSARIADALAEQLLTDGRLSKREKLAITRDLAEYLGQPLHSSPDEIIGAFRKAELYHGRIGELLPIIHWGYKDLLIATNKDNKTYTKIAWGRKAQETMCCALDAMDEPQRQGWLSLLRASLPEGARVVMDRRYEVCDPETKTRMMAGLSLKYSSTYALFQFADLYSPWYGQAATKMGIIGINSDASPEARALRRLYVSYKGGRDYFYGLPFWRYSEMIARLGVSPYWLLGLECGDTVLAKEPTTEQAMSAFCMLPAEEQDAIGKVFSRKNKQ